MAKVMHLAMNRVPETSMLLMRGGVVHDEVL